MRRGFLSTLIVSVAGLSVSGAKALAQQPPARPPRQAPLPPPPAEAALADWAFPWGDDVPGVISAAGLLDKPAGKRGPVVARDGHFYTGDKRIKFVGVNIAFAGNFPPEDKADAVAKRLAAFGVNVVRFHHMDNQPFPNGIFADKQLEKLSPEALDRLDYFVFALKQQGVYANLNLHVSRPFSRANKWPNADKLEGYDKQVDLFHPDLIAANKRYARDLLTHVNAYTKARYADEPAVAAVEINNEDTLFLWGGEQKLAALPEPYAGMLQTLWNAWLAKKYGGREKLAAAWAEGAELLGEDQIAEPVPAGGQWVSEQHGAARMRLAAMAVPDGDATSFHIDVADGTAWHLQHARSGLRLKKGAFYTVDFSGQADRPRKIEVAVGMAHAPWANLGLARAVELPGEGTFKRVRLGFVASADDDNARVSIQLGGSAETVVLGKVGFRAGGREGLRDAEDPAAGSVARGGLGGADVPVRSRDWYAFLQSTDEAYFVGMRDWLRSEIGVKAPITGTIGLGMLGTKSQSKMDFVDAHAYWDHPRFPRKQWDMKDWEIKNKPMVDDPAGATLWGLAATRVMGKPFTVTEYNHAAPNEWQAECVPMVLAYAAAQDWDAVYLFDYTGGTDYEKRNTKNFFSVEGNAAKMAALPLAARLFHGEPPAIGLNVVTVGDREMLDTASQYFHHQWPFVRDVKKLTWQEALNKRWSIAFEPAVVSFASAVDPPKLITWTAGGPGTGRFTLVDSRAAVFVGFAAGPMPIDLGAAKLTKLETPFAAVQLVPAEAVAGGGGAGKTLADADRLLLSAVARQSSAGMTWNADRTGVGTSWGKPPAKIEVVRGEVELSLAKAGGSVEVWALGLDGQRLKPVPVRLRRGTAIFPIGTEPTVWYEIVRK
jgi:hypothetical protein